MRTFKLIKFNNWIIIISTILLLFIIAIIINKWGHIKDGTLIEENTLNPETFIPDTTTIFLELFPWDDVKACMEDKLDGKQFVCNEPCPKCKLKSQNLYWINFKSPLWTWQQLCGRVGPLSICPKCRIQVEFICEKMN